MNKNWIIGFFRFIFRLAVIVFLKIWSYFVPSKLKAGDEVGKILVVIFGAGIGDVILSTPALRSLRNKYPHSGIILLTSKPSLIELIEPLGYVNKFMFFDIYDLVKPGNLFSFKSIRLLRNLISELRREHFDILIDLQGVESYDRMLVHGVFMFASNAGYRIGLLCKNIWSFLYHKNVFLNRNIHRTDMWLKVIQLIGCETINSQTEIKVGASEKQFARDILSVNNVLDNDFIVVIHPTGARPSRHWPAERFAELANQLILKYNAKIVLIGNESESMIAEKIAGMIKLPIINLAGKTPTTKHLASIIGQSNIFIGNDSGPMHMAIALKIPTIGILGPGYPDYFLYSNTPWYIYVRKDIDNSTCWPCEKYYCPDNQCLKLITVDDILTAVQKLLATFKGSKSSNQK
jgi:ADP-heptose:LPS heptosyltransferase